jgi:hypothetical protein
VGAPAVSRLKDLWRGTDTDAYGQAATLATTTGALLLLRGDRDLEAAREEATALWHARDTSRFD